VVRRARRLQERITNGDGVADEQQTVIPEGRLPAAGALAAAARSPGPDLYRHRRQRQRLRRVRHRASEDLDVNLEGQGKTLFASGLRNLGSSSAPRHE
jgi:hypothetical protein